MVAADAGGLPAAIVTTGITLIELETEMRVPTHVQNRHPEGTQT